MPPGTDQPAQPVKPPLPPGYFDADAQPVKPPAAAKPPLPPGYYDAEAQASAQPAEPPGFFKRLGQAVGVPTSMEELRAATTESPEDVLPGVPLAKMAINYGKNAYKGMKEGAQEVSEAGQNVAAGGPFLDNLGKATSGVVHAGLQATPIVGPAIETYGTDIANKNYRGAAGGATGIAAQILGPKLIENAPAMKRAVAETAPARAIAKPINMATEMAAEPLKRLGLVSPESPVALRQAIQPSVNIPRAGESIEIAGPRMQQLKNSGLVLDAEGNPLHEIKSNADVLQAVKAGKKYVYDAIDQRVGSVDQLQADTGGVADAMVKSISKRTREQFPALAARIEARAETYRGLKSFRDIENAIQDANDDLKNYYKHGSPSDSPVTTEIATTLAEVKTLRNLLDEKMETLTGSGVKDLKREYGALRDVERAAAKQNLVSLRQKGLPLYQGLAALWAAGDFASGNIISGAKGIGMMAMGKRLSQVRSPEWLVDQAFQGGKAFKAAPEIAPPPGPKIAGLIGPGDPNVPAAGSVGLAPNERGPEGKGGPSTAPAPIEVPANPRNLEQPEKISGIQSNEPSRASQGFRPPVMERPPTPPAPPEPAPPVKARELGEPKAPPNAAGATDKVAAEPSTGGTMRPTVEPAAPLTADQKLLPPGKAEAAPMKRGGGQGKGTAPAMKRESLTSEQKNRAEDLEKLAKTSANPVERRNAQRILDTVYSGPERRAQPAGATEAPKGSPEAKPMRRGAPATAQEAKKQSEAQLYKGQEEPGNIDVNHRPVVKNADGSHSTIFSMTVPAENGKWALIPSIVDGKFLTPDGKMPNMADKQAMMRLEDAATEHYKKTGEHLGIFVSPEAADAYASATHAYMPDGTERKVFIAKPAK